MTSRDDIAAILHRLFIAREGTSLRKEDTQKVVEVHAMVRELSRLRRGAHLVDAAAGKSSVGLIAAEVLPIGRLTVLERDPKRVAACREAISRSARPLEVDVVEADVRDEAAWPHAPDAVVALHACGPASDAVLDAAVRADARFLFLVPCCYGDELPFLPRAMELARDLGVGLDGRLERRLATTLVDQERVLRLESAGYETEVVELVGATITPHNLLLRARRTKNDARMARARARLGVLRGDAPR